MGNEFSLYRIRVVSLQKCHGIKKCLGCRAFDSHLLEPSEACHREYTTVSDEAMMLVMMGEGFLLFPEIPIWVIPRLTGHVVIQPGCFSSLFILAAWTTYKRYQ